MGWLPPGAMIRKSGFPAACAWKQNETSPDRMSAAHRVQNERAGAPTFCRLSAVDILSTEAHQSSCHLRMPKAGALGRSVGKLATEMTEKTGDLTIELIPGKEDKS